MGGDDEFDFCVSPLTTLDVTALIALTVRLACGAALDVFELLDRDRAELTVRVGSLDERLGHAITTIAEQLAASTVPEVQRALDVIHRRNNVE